ncbi:hypothetical protein PTIM40_122 [Cyanophage P-TIM40]|uniref:Uncharacterized protein n=1 Tax=Cyanophage P-TIM40 TaxID=1589733 RepID=A0A0C5AE92_9CAUD|nr:hypothetical protein AU107_gp122 [Cyanophage P-TIM40]AJK27549.1 hypothetical protein PTIM40_122 [Cyanophage P-TIM40]|tara:strand:- start:731 stop:946 length:216 start_codon:yes stop_codon:yes gene_type:complete
MRNPIRERMVDALIQHAKGQIIKHKMNVEIYLNQPVGIGQHSDIMDAIEKELQAIGKYHEQIEVISNYFND